MRGYLLAGILAGAFLAGGCERVETDRGLVVTPADARIGWEEAVTFTAELPEGSDEDRELLYPLEWSLSDPSLGTLRSAGGDTVVYVAGRRSGGNSILVRDQSGAKGAAAIVQSSGSGDGG